MSDSAQGRTGAGLGWASPEPLGHYAASIVETVREPLLVLDGALCVLLANAAFYRTFDVRPLETLGRPLFELGNGQWNVPALRSALGGIFEERGREVRDYEVVHDFERIGRRTTWLNARELGPTSAGGPRLLLLGVEDVTDRRRAEIALQWHARDVERSNDELEQFAFVASHDLQEPLRKIRAYGDLLTAECAPQLGAQGAEYVERMVSAGARMQTLISALLSLSRVTTAARAVAPVSLEHAVRDVLRDIEVSLGEADGDVRVGELPTVEADLSQMRQLFQNLLGNALKFRRAGVPPRVTIEARAAAGPAAGAGGPRLYEIEVRDNGIGFEQRYCDRIFAPFQRLHSRSAYEGTGIGLTICRKIVERHGGSLAARSTPGQGSSFTFTLPARQHSTD